MKSIGVPYLWRRKCFIENQANEEDILKPSFVVVQGTSRVDNLWQKKHHIGWWITSASESNINLNLVAHGHFQHSSAARIRDWWFVYQ
jgi:hypothetical protein